MTNEVLSRAEAHEGPGGAELTRKEAAAVDRASVAPSSATPLAPVTLGGLFWVFFVLGATSFGGGVVAYLRQALVVKQRWLDDDTFREQARSWPLIAPLRELRHALSEHPFLPKKGFEMH
jgi:hypothetical protein